MGMDAVWGAVTRFGCEHCDGKAMCSHVVVGMEGGVAMYGVGIRGCSISDGY